MATETQREGLANYADVMKHLNISRQTLNRIINQGELPVIYINTAPRIEWSEVDRYVDSKRKVKQS